MKYIADVYGYSLYEKTKEECMKDNVTYPYFCAFDDDEEGERDIYSEKCSTETIGELLQWCKEYRR